MVLHPVKKSRVYEPFRIRDCHTFGCPVYILHDKLQTVGSELPKWQPWSRLGIYLGQSPCYVGNVALVLNPLTLHISP